MIFGRRKQEDEITNTENYLYPFNDVKKNIAETILTRQDSNALIEQLQYSIKWLEENSSKLSTPLYEEGNAHILITNEQREQISEIISNLNDIRNKLMDLVDRDKGVDYFKTISEEIVNTIDNLLDYSCLSNL